MRSMAFLSGVIIALCAAGLPQAKGKDANEANVVECNLWYKPSGFHLSLIAEATSAVKETKGPDFGKRMVSRGVIKSRSKDAGPMLFVWDKSQRKLYFDLNKNLDLTDDTNGVFSSNKHSPYQFWDMHIEKHIGDSSVPYLVNAWMLSGNYYQFKVLSGFQGEVELGGKRWRVTLADNLDGAIGHGDYFAITSADSNFKVPMDEYDKFAPKEVFLDGRNWQLAYEFAVEDGGVYVRARFKETSRPTGKVKIEGQFISYLSFKKNSDLTMAVLERPEGVVVLPVGDYDIGQVYLDGGNAGLFGLRDYPQGNLTIEENKPSFLTIGGPLNSSVEVRRVGRVLRLSYKLKGIDGKIYKTADIKDKKAPTFAVFRGDKEIGSGTFSFG